MALSGSVSYCSGLCIKTVVGKRSEKNDLVRPSDRFIVHTAFTTLGIMSRVTVTV